MPEHVEHLIGQLRRDPDRTRTRYVGTGVMNALPYDLTLDLEHDANGPYFRLRVTSDGPTLEEEIEAAGPMPEWMRHEPRERPRTMKVKR